MPCFGSRKKAKRRSPHGNADNLASEKTVGSTRPTPSAAPAATTPSPVAGATATTAHSGLAPSASLETQPNPEKAATESDASATDRPGRPGSIISSKSVVVAQIRQEYNELKNKQSEHLDVIARQSVELEELRQQLDAAKQATQAAREQPDVLQEKEELLRQRENEIKQLLQKIESSAEQAEKQATERLQKKLAEQEQQLREKERQLEELQSKKNQAELIKPVLDDVTRQLNELKTTNQEATARLADKEKELNELRAQLSRRRPAHKDEDEARQKRLNRLTMDLESDRLMIQKLEELNQQLEAQKQKHEAILQSHAEEMAEKDRELVQQQQSLADLKLMQERAIKALERKQAETIRDLEMRHARDTQSLKERLENAERRAKSDMNDEVEKLLHEFEQTEHNHSVQMAHLHRSHQEQLSAMKQGQEAELQNHIKRTSMVVGDAKPMTLRRTGGPVSKTIRWPVAALQDQTIELTPRDPAMVQVYVSSVSANPTIKRNQESLQTMLTANHITFQVVDVAQSEPALQHMRRQNTSGGSRLLPQIFVGGEYRGQYEDVVKAVEQRRLAELIQPRKDKPSPVSVRSKGSFSSNEPLTPTTSSATTSSISSMPATPRLRMQREQYSEDDDLLREIEKELAQSDFSKIDLNF